MNIKLRQSFAILAALCWIFAQNISLDHQYTSEHLSKSDTHICLSFANDNDDLLISSPTATQLPKQHLNIFTGQVVVLGSLAQLGFQARAPPITLS